MIPEIYDWQIELLQRNGSSFLLCIYDCNGRKLIGTIIGEKVSAIRFDKAPQHWSCRMLRYLKADEPYVCVVCKEEKYEGWHWQQDLEYFICTGCSQKN